MTWRLCSVLGLGLLGVVASSTKPSHADVAPPSGFVESCTVEQQQAPNKECVSCGDSYYKEPDACAHKLEPAGYTRSCKARGASTWKEVWCRKTEVANGGAPVPSATATPPATPASVAAPAAAVVAAEPPKPPSSDPASALPENAPKRGCGACVVGGTDPGAGAASFALLLGLLAVAYARKSH